MKILKQNKLVIVYIILLIISTYLVGFLDMNNKNIPIGEYMGFMIGLMIPSFIAAMITLPINKTKIPIVICSVQVCVIIFILILLRPYL